MDVHFENLNYRDMQYWRVNYPHKKKWFDGSQFHSEDKKLQGITKATRMLTACNSIKNTNISDLSNIQNTSETIKNEEYLCSSLQQIFF